MRFLFVIMALMMCSLAFSQTYLSGNLNYRNSAGDFDSKAMLNGEVGYNFNKVKVGVAVGVLSLTNVAKIYSELRVQPTLFTLNRFNVSGVLGAGFVYNNSPRNLLTEYGGAVNYDVTKSFSLSLSAGAFHFNGKTGASRLTHTGVGFSYLF